LIETPGGMLNKFVFLFRKFIIFNMILAATGIAVFIVLTLTGCSQVVEQPPISAGIEMQPTLPEEINLH